MFANLLNDVRYSLRGFAAKPLFAVIAVLTLALGIGANAAIFSVLHGLFLRPLPYPDGERLVEVHNTYPNMGLENAGTSIPDYLDRREQATSLEDLAMYTFASYNLAPEGGQPERLVALRATPSLFTTLRSDAALGRVFTEEHAVPGADKVVVLSHALWTNRFNADPGIVGRDIRLSGEPYRVLGVMPESFGFPNRNMQMWVPFAFTPEQRADTERGNEYSSSIGRLKPGATIEQANAEFDAIVARTADRVASAGEDGQGFADFLRGANFTGRAQSLREFEVGDARDRTLLLQAAVLMVLLIAVANVANLMLTRLTARQKELSVRNALGASRLRIVRGVLVESLMLAVVGGVLGVLLAHFAIEFLTAFIRGGGAASAYAPRLDGTVLLFAFGLSLLTGLLAATFPVFSLLRLNINDVIKEGGRLAGGGRAAAWSRSALVVGQIALATTLLVGAGLLLKSFQTLQAQSPGFRPDGVTAATIVLPGNKYPDAAAQVRFFEQALQRLRETPGVDHASYTSSLPFSGNNASGSYTIDGFDVADGDSSPHGMQRSIDEDYFDTIGITLLKGRAFGPEDRADAPPVVIIDQLLADKYFKGRDPIGQRINRGGPWATVVGVVSTIKHGNLAADVQKETLYWPYRQQSGPAGALVVRSALGTGALLKPMRDAILAVDPEQPIFDIKSLDERIAISIGEQRFVMQLVGAFAAVALILSAIGIYGVLAFAVGQRTGELGVRMAIGAGAGQILGLVMGQGARLTGIGLLIGLIGAAFSAQSANALLFGVEPFDLLVYLPVTLFLGATALFACWLPARRAARIDPLVALRYE